MVEFNTYEEVQNRGQNTISTRCVLMENADEVRARLVVKSFEELFREIHPQLVKVH